MGLLDNADMVDAKRFEVIAHATVMKSGRLRFATDAMEMMDLRLVNSIILFSFASRSPDAPSNSVRSPVKSKIPEASP